MANMATLAGHVHVEERAVIGGLAAFHQFVRVGRLAMVGGTAGVMQDVPPFCMVQGSPPATVRGLNRIGIMRNGATEESFIALKQAFRLLFRRGMTKDNALAEIEASIPKSPELTHFLNWFRAESKRGIMKAEPAESLSVVSAREDRGDSAQSADQQAQQLSDAAALSLNTVLLARVEELTRRIDELGQKLG
jgi:hypothetical protein